MESKKSSNWSLQMMRWFLGNRTTRTSCIPKCPSLSASSAHGYGKTKTTTTTTISTTKSAKRRIKLIRAADGVVQIYERPIQVSQLISQFPKHMVCTSDSFYIGQKILPLSNHHRLKRGQTYFLLPNHFFHSALSFLTITTFIASTTQSQSQSQSQSSQHHHFKKALLTSQPFHIHKTPSGVLRVNVSEDFISKLIIMEQGSSKVSKHHHHHHHDHHLCTTRQLQKDYAQLVTPRLWKPKLDTIKEKHEKKTKTTTTTSQSCALKTLRKKSSHQTLHIQKKKTPNSRFVIRYSSSSSSSSSLSPKLTSKSKIKSFLAATRKKKQVVI